MFQDFEAGALLKYPASGICPESATIPSKLSMQVEKSLWDWFSNTRRGNMAISKELLDILACPKCKGDIYLNDSQDGLICDKCKLLYEIRDDIPIMLIDEAKPID